MVKTFSTDGGKFTVTVKQDFFVKNGEEVEKHGMYELVTQFKLPIYLHNEVGPALIDHENNRQLYFVNGKEVRGKDLEEFKHNLRFSEKLEELLEK